MNADRHNTNEWQIVKVNKKWKTSARNDADELVNRSAAHREITSKYDQLKQLEGINNDLKVRNKN
jgi:hypothetical protein